MVALSLTSIDPITVTFDADGFLPGDYAAALDVTSDDPVNPSQSIPALMTVEAPGPNLVFDPEFLEATVPFGGQAQLTLTASNNGDVPITFIRMT